MVGINPTIVYVESSNLSFSSPTGDLTFRCNLQVREKERCSIPEDTSAAAEGGISHLEVNPGFWIPSA